MSGQSEEVGIAERIWSIFSSMKTGLALLGAVAVVAGLGTLIPQEAVEPEKAQTVSAIWKTLGFTNLYSTIWFRLILGLLCVNLIVCSVQRFGGIYRKTFKPNPPQSSTAIPKKVQAKITGPENELREAATKVLTHKGYRLTTSEQKGSWSFIAQKRRLGNWGSLLTHLAFVVLILGALGGSMIGFKGYFMAGVGDTLSIKQIELSKGNVNENFSMKINSAEDRVLANGERDNWYTDMSIIESGKEVARQTLSVNHPFIYKGVTFYQANFAQGGKFTVDLKGQKIPVFLQNEGGNYFQAPGTDLYLIISAMKADPKAPVVLYQVFKGNSSQPLKMGQMNLGQADNIDNTFTLTFDGLAGYTGLQVKKDPGVNVVWVGSALLMLGLILSFYWRPYTISGILETDKESSLTLGAAGGKLAAGTKEEFNHVVTEIEDVKKRESV